MQAENFYFKKNRWFEEHFEQGVTQGRKYSNEAVLPLRSRRNGH
jgi:hypothetical protein